MYLRGKKWDGERMKGKGERQNKVIRKEKKNMEIGKENKGKGKAKWRR